jgi:hypothetical protein
VGEVRVLVEGLNLNVAKSFLGKNVNLHLKDGSVVVNVRVDEIRRDLLKGEVYVRCCPIRESLSPPDTFKENHLG